MLISALVLQVCAVACSHRLKGPKEPTVEEDELTYCGDELQSFVIHGTKLSPMVVDGATKDARIQMPEVCLTRVSGADGETVSDAEPICIADEDVEWVSQTELHFTTRASLGLTSGEYDVTVTNPDGTRAEGGPIRLTVLADGLLVFWADPGVVYDGIATQITVYGVNLGIVEAVDLVECEGGAEVNLDFTADPDRNNRLQAIVPAGAAPGTCSLRVTSANGCQATLVEGVRVTDTVEPSLLAEIDPRFGFSDAPTPVTISGSGFAQVPRAYLNPVDPGPGTVASTLSSVAFVSGDRLTGVVPSGLPVGSYDLIVVNPDGKVGILEAAFQVTANAPPVVDSVTPNYLRNDGIKTMTVDGENLAPSAVAALCRSPGGGELTLDGQLIDGGSASSFDFTLDVSSLDQGTVCVVTVHNADGSYFEYSAIGIANPSLNLNEFSSGPEMTRARRAPAVAAARVTRAARFLYAIGGDDGSPSGATASVESTPIDIFGEPGTWFEQPVSLPGPRTLAAVARIGRYLYLVGGNDGSQPTRSVLRAQVLDPLAAPAITDVAARRAEQGEGIGSGVWYYRISAVMADDDPSNPGGETLAGDPLAITLSDRIEGALVPTLIWEAVPGAKGYRIYRSESGEQAVGEIELLAEVQGGDITSYEDTRTSGSLEGGSPLPLGATGVWMALGELSEAREAPGLTAARDPVDASLWHLYAIGGRDGSGALASWERLGVTVAADSSHQAASSWVGGGGALSAARSELSAYAVTHVEAVQVPAGVTYVYAAGGAGSSNVDVAEVVAGGDLSWSETVSMTPPRAGYAGVAGGGSLFAFGGAQSAPSDGNVKAEIDPGSVPELINWNNEGVRLLTPRYLAGGAVESAFIYVVGGSTSSGATASMEKTVL
ncbi:MAG: hypothetical protein OEZ06_06105 [Myxococcales bacterium]|nr:hypothetical protein [Myxococcales bacterium]